MREVGRIFTAAVELREDSNYESLILAHQYQHALHQVEDDRYLSISMDFRQLNRRIFVPAQDRILRFLSAVLREAFVDDRAWFCPAIHFPGRTLFDLTRWHVDGKIDCANARWAREAESPEEWWSPLDGLMPFRQDDGQLRPVPDEELAENSHFGLFGMKRDMMVDFQNRIIGLGDILRAQLEQAEDGL